MKGPWYLRQSIQEDIQERLEFPHPEGLGKQGDPATGLHQLLGRLVRARGQPDRDEPPNRFTKALFNDNTLQSRPSGTVNTSRGFLEKWHRSSSTSL